MARAEATGKKVGFKIEDDDALVYTVPQAGKLIGLNRNASHEAVKRGEIPVIRFGDLMKVPKKRFHAMLEGSAGPKTVA